MDRNYQKNILIRRVKQEPFFTTYETVMNTITSTTVINSILEMIVIGENESDLVSFISLINKRVSNDMLLRKKCENVYFTIILTELKITYFSYNEVFSLFQTFIPSRLNCKQLNLVAKRFTNYSIYKTTLKDFKFDFKICVDFNNQIEKITFLNLFTEITIRNKNDEKLKKFISELQIKETHPLLAILGIYRVPALSQTTTSCLIDFNDMSEKYISHINPLYIKNIQPDKYLKLFLCYLNRESLGKCKICYCDIRLFITYFDANQVKYNEMLEKLKNNPIIDNSFISHIAELATEENLKTILHEILYNNIQSHIDVLSCFPTIKFEDIYLEHVKSIFKKGEKSRQFMILKIMSNLGLTPKISFGLFMIAFLLYKSYRSNEYARLKIKNLCKDINNDFMNIKEMIFQYLFLDEAKTTGYDNDTFNILSEFFDCDSLAFLENNIYYILPLVLHNNLKGLIDISDEQISDNIYYLIGYYILNDIKLTEDTTGFNTIEILEKFKPQIIAMIVLIDESKIDVLKEKYLDFSDYIFDNILLILFHIRNMYISGHFIVPNDILSPITTIIIELKERFLSCFMQVFSYIEYSICRGGNSRVMDMVFENYRLQLNHISLSLPYMSCEKVVMIIYDTPHVIDNLIKIGRLMLRNETLSNKIAIYERIIVLIRVIFSNTTNPTDADFKAIKSGDAIEINYLSNDSGVIKNIIEIFRSNFRFRKFILEFNRKLCSNVKNNSPIIINFLGSIGDYQVISNTTQLDHKIKYEETIQESSSSCEDDDIYYDGWIENTRTISKITLLEEETDVSNEFNIINNENGVIFDTNEISKVILNSYLSKIDVSEQDIYFYVIQETLKYLKNVEDIEIQNREFVLQFKKSRYFMNLETISNDEIVLNLSLSYETFISDLFMTVLNILKSYKFTEMFDLLKYGTLLGVETKEYYLLAGIKVLVDNNKKNQIAKIFSQILNCSKNETDNRILQFALISYQFLKGSDGDLQIEFINLKKLLEVAIHLKKYRFAIYILEKLLKKDQDDTRMWDAMMYCSYCLNDYDIVTGINSKFDRLSNINLFFNFCIEKKFNLAASCLNEDNEMYSYMREILSHNDVDSYTESDIKVLIKKIATSNAEMEEWRYENEHTKKVGDINRFIFNNDRVSCKEYMRVSCSKPPLDIDLEKSKVLTSLSFSMNSKIERLHLIKDIELFCSKDYDLAIDRILSLNEVNFQNCERLLKIFKRSEICNESDLRSLDYFERTLKIKKIESFISKAEYENATSEITMMLINKDWWVLYEHAKIQIAQNNMIGAKNSLKKLLKLLHPDDKVYKKGIILQAEIYNNRLCYLESIAKIGDCEKLFYLQGKYYQKYDLLECMKSFKNALKHGREFRGEIIPIMFHIFCEDNIDVKKPQVFYKECKKIFLQLIEDFPKDLFLPFFTQILPKLGHKNNDVYDVLKVVLSNLLNNFPEVTFWNVFIYMNTNNKDISQRIVQILNDIKINNKIIFNNFKYFAHLFCQISEFKSNISELSLKTHLKLSTDSLPRLVTMPNKEYSTTIAGINDEIKVFCSLQSPKRIGLTGEDGRTYLFLCKPNDDLRKDNRFIDLIILLNELFASSGDIYKIRVYNVIPITFKYGIIEWVDNLTSYKSICDEYYQKMNISIIDSIKKYRTRKKIGADFATLKKAFPPVFQLHFQDHFRNIDDWYVCKKRYVLTYAVMSMVGWFIGLGDRHGENIMFDSVSGDTVHVDLNCLFEKGKNFEVPEKVPFRLTQNLVAAFGPLGVDGSFRKTSEMVLKIMVENRELIMANLLPFIYDPLIEWNRKLKVEQILETLKKKLNIEDIQQQVENLIVEATADTNLCNMYIGWLSFI